MPSKSIHRNRLSTCDSIPHLSILSPPLTSPQYYHVLSLYLPHCQISSSERPTFDSMIEIAKHDYGLKVVHVKADQDYRDNFLFVCNHVPPGIANAIDWQALTAINTMEDPTHNVSNQLRGNKGYPVGATGAHNSGRSMETLGLAKPRQHKGTSNPILSNAMAVLSQALRTLFYEDGPIPVTDTERNIMFRTKVHLQSLFESGGLYTNDAFIAFALHCDWHNPGRNDLDYGPCSGLTKFVEEYGRWTRAAVLGHNKKAVDDYMKKWRLHAPVLKQIMEYYAGLPEALKVISPSLFPSANMTTHKRMQPHMNKAVFFSPYIDVIAEFRNDPVFETIVVPTGYWGRVEAGAIVNVTTSNSPDHYRKGMKELRDHCAAGKFPTNPGLFLYQYIWKLKREDHTNKKPVAGQRYQPSHNKVASDFQVNKSMETICRLAHELRQLDSKELSQAHTFQKATGILCTVVTEDSHGCYGAGPLTAQHILHVGSLLGTFPAEFLNCAEIGCSTKTYQYLVSDCNYDESLHSLETQQLLEASSFALGVPIAIAENVICKWKMDKTGTDGNYGDSSYTDQKAMYYYGCHLGVNKVLSMDSKGNITPFLALFLPIKCNSGSVQPALLDFPLAKKIPPKKKYPKPKINSDSTRPMPKSRKRKSDMAMGGLKVMYMPTGHQVCIQKKFPFNPKVTAHTVLSIKGRLSQVLILQCKYDRVSVGYVDGSIGSSAEALYPPADFALYPNTECTIVREGRRWFHTGKAANAFCLWFILYTRNCFSSLSLPYSNFDEEISGSKRNGIRRKKLNLGDDGFCVYYNPESANPAMFPMLVVARYGKHGHGFYLTNNEGEAISESLICDTDKA